MSLTRLLFYFALFSLGALSVHAFRGRAGPPEEVPPPLPRSLPECPDSGEVVDNTITGQSTTRKRNTNAPTTARPYPISSLRPSMTTPKSSITKMPTNVFTGPPTMKPGSGNTGGANQCPKATKFGRGPPSSCQMPIDPNNKPPSQIESWFTKAMFEDLFPFANLGWGPNPCWPYSYEAFVIAARYFPEFGTSSPNTNYTAEQNHKRDLAAFFAHAVQETGENNAALYAGKTTPSQIQEASNCFYRGGFFNWFEGGPTSSFLDPANPGYQPIDGEECGINGKYCAQSAELNYWFGCDQSAGKKHNMSTGCYFGRGAIQISYNYNYGMFQNWLASLGINVNLLSHPNLVMTKMDPPLAVMASLWFYMTPQPPKPAMHDIMMGSWNSGAKNVAAGYSGPLFGPTSLIINNECNGEDHGEPGGPGESRRIKAFKWFCQYFGIPSGPDNSLTCKDMPVKLDMIPHAQSYQPNWGSTWKEEPCTCAPAPYAGMVSYFDPNFYPARFVALNAANKLKCERSLYDNPSMYSLDPKTTPCLNHKK